MYDFNARSSTRRISDETFSLKGSSTVIKIQGDIEGPIYDVRDGHRRTVELHGPNTTAFVDGNVSIRRFKIDSADLIVSGIIKTFKNFEVSSRKGESILHTGGIADDSVIDVYATYKNFTILFPTVTKSNLMIGLMHSKLGVVRQSAWKSLDLREFSRL